LSKVNNILQTNGLTPGKPFRYACGVALHVHFTRRPPIICLTIHIALLPHSPAKITYFNVCCCHSDSSHL